MLAPNIVIDINFYWYEARQKLVRSRSNYCAHNGQRAIILLLSGFMKELEWYGMRIRDFCLCWGLTSQSTIFQSCRDGATASWVINQYFQGVKCLAQGHNTAAVGFEPPTSRSGVQHSTTEPPRSPQIRDWVSVYSYPSCLKFQELTSEEIRKKLRRRQQNKDAARRCRAKKKRMENTVITVSFKIFDRALWTVVHLLEMFSGTVFPAISVLEISGRSLYSVRVGRGLRFYLYCFPFLIILLGEGGSTYTVDWVINRTLVSDMKDGEKIQNYKRVCCVAYRLISPSPFGRIWASSWDYGTYGHLSHGRPAKAQASLRIRAVSPEHLLFAHIKYGSRRRVRPKIRHLTQLDGCACAFDGWVYGGRNVSKVFY